MTMRHTLIAATAALALAGCATTAQYTSGADYLARYSSEAYAPSTSTDAAVRDIAAVEPDLRFPARIGLARIEYGKLISVPTDEAAHWQDAAAELGPEFGEFIPVSPLIADMVNRGDIRQTGSVVDHIRRGAARQHLDYVVTYEVTDLAESKGNAIRVADLTILGLFVLPSRNLKAESSASAILLDVRNGYPYLTGSTFADEKGISTVVGKRAKKDALKDATRSVAVAQIADEFAEGLKDLKLVADGIKLAESRQSDAANR